ncbi:hypothetical protein F5B19DRAFT_47865 [Rostrohypoxylon terebratum]|nr:hypothetical protein F5B19DRAFT_47865 [Rostrohypoxylon terebratum]
MTVAKDDRSKPSTNGSTKGKKGVNGNNGVNGINGNKLPSTTRPRSIEPKKKKKGFFAWSFSIVARLLSWYSILIIIFRCPSNLEACTDATPRICKPYFGIKSIVSPHVTPYYDTYAAPYVDVAKPYYNTIDRIIITPTRTYAVRYGGPRVDQARVFSQAQWEKNVQPKLSRYQTLAKTRYDETIAPHVESVSAAVLPYYEIARTNALQTYHEVLLPSYLFVQPYAAQGYDVAYTFITDTVVPSTKWGWNKTCAFLDSTVWPHLRDLYVMKVEPQLVRIGERLGRYKEKKVKSVMEEVNSSAPKSTFAKPTASTTSTTALVVESSVEPETNPPASEVEASDFQHEKAEIKVGQSKSRTPEEIREHAAKTVAEDLELWEGKFTKAAEEGATEIESRVDEIANRMIEKHANGEGKSLVKQLDDTATAELESLKKSIVSILAKYSDNAEKRDEALQDAIRAAGIKIRDSAHSVRAWRQTYEQEAEIAVTKAAEEHYNILEKTSDLALQKIGMKWAWMEGITYKDWKKYHELKARFEQWTDEFKELITTHPGILAAQAAGIEIEDEAMGIAQAAAMELGRLKQVATWKAIAGDFSDNFDSEMTELAAIDVARKAARAAQSATSESSPVAEEAERVFESVAEASVEQDISADAETVIVSLSQADAEATAASESTSTTASSSTEAALADVDGLVGSPSSEPTAVPEQVQETIVEVPDNPIVPVEEVASTTSIKSALFGAAAQSVPSRQPILDDSIDSSASSILSVAQSDIPASITSVAQSAYTAAIAGAADHYSRAMSVVSAQIHGQPKPVHEEMFSSVSNAYFGAVASANSRLNAVMMAASQSIHGTPTAKWIPSTPTIPSVDWERVQSIAQQNLDDSVKWASEQYEAAKVAVGAAEPTPSTYLESAEKKAAKILDQAKHNYYAGIGLAHARYSEFLSAASIAATPTPTNIQESASSAVSAAGDVVGENWDALVSRVSLQIYAAPTPTPWYENLNAVAADLASAASDYATSATDVAASQVSTATELVGDYASSANDAAASQYSIVSSLVSELIVGKEPPFTESVYSRLAGAYSTGIASASSVASAASATVASVASEASDTVSSIVDAAAEKVKGTAQHGKDEL